MNINSNEKKSLKIWQIGKNNIQLCVAILKYITC